MCNLVLSKLRKESDPYSTVLWQLSRCRHPSYVIPRHAALVSHRTVNGRHLGHSSSNNTEHSTLPSILLPQDTGFPHV